MVLQRPRQWCHPRMPQLQGVFPSPALPPSVQPGQHSAPDLSVQCHLDPTRDQAGSTRGPALPAKSIPAQSSLLASRPPVDPPELGRHGVLHSQSLLQCRQPALRSQQPCSAVNRLLDCPQFHRQQGLLGRSLQRLVIVCPHGHRPHLLGGSCFVSRGVREVRICKDYVYTGRVAS